MFDPDRYPQVLVARASELLRLVDTEYASKRILDFGCQGGTVVHHFRAQGVDMCGFDIGDAQRDGFIRRCPVDAYEIPWPDATFDVVFSHHVFEHVQDPEAAVTEIWRVLKPGGVMIHAFPARWRLFEAHFFTPFGGVIRHPFWYLSWSWLKKRGRQHLGLRAYAREAHALTGDLWYPSWPELTRAFQPFRVESAAGLYFSKLTGLPVAPDRLVSAFHLRVIRGRRE